ncbi:MAG: Helix-turn-helix domain [Bacteroidota bacterium]|jgi:excisionase family DNA binding protein
MWENKTKSTETPSIKLLEERLGKVERILNQLAEEVKEPKKEMKYLDVASAAKILGLSRAQMYILMRDGKLPYTHVGRQRRLILSDLVNFVEKGYKPARKSII